MNLVVRVFSFVEIFHMLFLAVFFHCKIVVVGTVYNLLQVFLPRPEFTAWSRFFTSSWVLNLVVNVNNPIT